MNTKSPIIAEAEDRLPKLAVGEAATFTLPTEQPTRWRVYTAIQMIAFHQFGSGYFSISSDWDGAITVTRTSKQPYPPTRRQVAASLKEIKR